jgi:membrane protease YdiL (CAAX protease family)
MKERLGPADYRYIAVCAGLLLGTTWYSARNFQRAFPEASIDFRVSREQGRQLAERFLAGQGYRTQGYREASSFTFDDDAKTFLEREAGLEQANQLMGTRLQMWRWSYRWFRPQQKEELRADITAGGVFAGFAHELAEDAARPDATDAEARSLAEDFLRTRARMDPASLDFVESSNVKRPKRTDRVFTWKERDFSLHDSALRREVTVEGNEVGGYRAYLKIPEQWTRDYERLRSKNNMAQTFDTVVMVALLLGLVAVIVMRVRRQDVRWRGAALIGMTGMALSFLSTLNEFPLSEFGYPTTDAYGSFVTAQLLQALLSALALGGLLFVIAAGAETVYREAYPQQISLGNLFRPRGLGTKRFFLGAILGITLTGIFIAYQTAFYITASKYGAWSPADVPYSDLLNTKFPWLYVLFGGFFPAVSEEFVFRMFAIPFLRKLTRWLPAAVVLAGFIWGFGHTGYPNQPFFIRGLEVGIGGVALGIIMLRWGILPTLVWHYSVDAMYSAMLLLRSHSLYFRLSGAASAGIILLPVAVALVAYWMRGGFEPDTGLRNADEPVAVEPPETAPAVVDENAAYQPLGGRLRLTAVCLLAVGMVALFIPAGHIGESPRFKLTADQAEASASAFVRAQGIDPGAFRHVTFPAVHWGGYDSLAGKYFLERLPESAAARLFERYRPVQHWATRYFKSLDKEEFLVTVHPETGKVMGYLHQIPENRPGADISDDAARQLSTAFAAAQGLDVAAMELKENTSEQRKARRDHTLEWDARPGDPRNVNEAHYRVAVEVDGDRVASLRAYWKIPESFERSREQQNFVSIAALALKIGAIAGAIVFGLWMLIRNVRLGLVKWRRVLGLAVLPTAGLAVMAALSLPITLSRQYQTSMPFETWQAILVAGLAMSLAFGYVMYGAGAALVTSFYPECVAAFRTSRRRLLGTDALVALAAAAGLWGISRGVDAALTSRFHAQAILEVGAPNLIGDPAPALEAVAAAIGPLFINAAIIAIAALLVGMLRKAWMVAGLVAVAAAAVLSSEIRTPGELALQYRPALLTVACAAVFCRWFGRRNYLAYALVFFVMALRSGMMELFGTGNASLQTQGCMVAAVGALGIAWAVWPAWRKAA